jgi:hypothetical protein
LVSLSLAMMQVPSHSATHTKILQQRQLIEPDCLIEAREQTDATAGRDVTLVIRCGGRVVLKDDFNDASINDISVSVHEPTLISVSWESAAGAALAVYVLDATTPGKVTAKSVWGGRGETVDGGAVLFEELGRRELGDLFLPAVTNVYRWKNGKYVFEAGYTWRKNASWESRYCVLVNAVACPAVRSAKVLAEPKDE